MPKDFRAAGTYQEFPVDFILRSAGYWGFRVYTEGNQPFTADIVKVFPLALLEDKQLLELYPAVKARSPPISSLTTARIHSAACSSPEPSMTSIASWTLTILADTR